MSPAARAMMSPGTSPPVIPSTGPGPTRTTTIRSGRIRAVKTRAADARAGGARPVKVAVNNPNSAQVRRRESTR
jgi:hypothetical protein